MNDDKRTSDENRTERADAPGPAGATERAVVTGRPAGAPFVLLGGVALAIWAVVAILAVALLLVWWLA